MILTKKIAQISALIFLVFSLASCKEECIAPDEFDTFSVIVESNPVKDGIYGLLISLLEGLSRVVRHIKIWQYTQELTLRKGQRNP